jgi:hypothetical protein
MNNFKYIIITFLISCLSFNLYSAEKEDAVAILNSQIAVIAKIKRFVDVQDLGRLIVLKNATQQTIDRINVDGIAHTRTLNEYLKQYITYKSSTAYFTYISTPVIADYVKQLYDIMDNIAHERGLDDFTFNKMTYNTFSQMHILLTELVKGNVSEELKAELNSLNVDFGHLLAIANSGDNIPTFKEGADMYHKIEALYPSLYTAANKGPLYDLILNIQGLNELYAEYAGI